MLSALTSDIQAQIRPFNFAPGPSALPEPVLNQIAAELFDWGGTNISIIEMSHRSKDFMGIYEQAIADLRELLRVPTHFKILFMQGGATAQNAAVPMNISHGESADFIITGSWSEKSAEEAKKYCQAHTAVDARNTLQGYYGIPAPATWQIRASTRYVHICSNETVHGVEFQELPDLKEMTGKDIPLVLDASSHILSRPIDWSRVGLVFAGAQKNIGIAGLTIVFVREDLMGQAMNICPIIFDYAVMAKTDSMYNTPPTFAIYVAGLIFQWIKLHGGLEKMEANAIARSELIYNCIDCSEGFYTNPVEKSSRSRMNIPFFLKDEKLNEFFIQKAKENRILNIQGHKMTGGMRASVYNAMPLEGAKILTSFMETFAKQHG
ncbi:MAG: 3-phosphoserine/phosphohydroxythreonine transaminase [Saezia sp.]